ncbi:hypothetical protein V3C99_018451 [Haemonchus contortus]|uniref:Chromo domain-containing protein n=1 Tax=Haemonchus contortus TaxID=6289 RepID=A0A7I4Z3Z7_HAECO
MRDLPFLNCDEDGDITFVAWYKCYGPVIDDWGSSLSDERYDFKIEYRKTTDSGRADALSPLIAEQAEQAEYIAIAAASHQAELEICSRRQMTEESFTEDKKLIHTSSFSLTPRRLALLRTKDRDPVKTPESCACLVARRTSVYVKDKGSCSILCILDKHNKGERKFCWKMLAVKKLPKHQSERNSSRG